MTVGSMLFWGGIAGAAAFALAGIITWLILRHSRKRLLNLIEREYQ